MAAEGFKRKLTAVFSADAVGYSHLMGDDESATVKTLETYKGVMFALIKQHRGRVVDSPGDNLLADFGSVVDAVQCAVVVQKELQTRNADLPEDRRMQFRIGINLGDVIEEHERIYGDGVNIAARLEALADPGGICISKTAFDYIENKLPFVYRFIGKQSVKNIVKPIGAYKVLMEPRVIDGADKVGLKTEPLGKSTAIKSDLPSIAVLPFINMSNDPEQEYFSDGMSEELIGALAKLQGLKVISRTSAFHFKGKDTDLRTIGEKLKVEHVLEGSVRKSGNKLRISAQLIKVADDTHLWAETYDRELKDVFAIQDEISQAIVKNLKVKLLGGKTEVLVKDYAKNPEAYELFLKGRFFQSKGYSGWERAVEFFEKAIKSGPEFSPAYSNLAATYFSYAAAFSPPSKEIWSKAKRLVRKALEIDEMDAIAHASMGTIKAFSEYDWQGAERNFKRAIELNPGNSYVHFRYGIYLTGMGRKFEGIEKMKRTQELDPLSINFHFALSISYYMARQFDKAIAQSQKTLELAPNNPSVLAILALSNAAKGMYNEGITMIRQVKNIPIVTAFLGYMYGKVGKREEAQEILDDFLDRSKHGYFSPIMIAAVYTGLGDKDKVFEWLEISFEERDINNWCIKVEPLFDDVRLDPRWPILMDKMGLAD